MVEVVL